MERNLHLVKSLTSLRFFFALGVFFHHLIFIVLTNESSVFNKFYDIFFSEGYIGVTFFFILSGYILSYVYSFRISDKTSLIRFYIRRIAKLYPLHIITLFLALPLSFRLFQDKPLLWWSSLFTNSALIQSYFPFKSFYFSFNLVSWSISCEAFFYLLFPIIFFITSKWKDRYWVLSLIVIACCLVISMNSVDKELQHAVFYINPFVRCLDFFFGIALYNLTRKLNFKSIIIGKLVIISSLALFIFFCIISRYIPDVYRFSIYYWIPMATVITAYANSENTLIIDAPFFVKLGEMSYSFYIIHFLIIKYFVFFNSRFTLKISPILLSLLAFVFSISAGFVCYIIFEKKLKRLLINKLESLLITGR